MLRNLPILTCCLLGILHCATIDPKEIPAPTEQVAFEPQKIQISYDVLLLRIDLKRQYTTETRTVTTTDAQGKTHTTTQQVSVPVPYHYLGVDLGNGIFLDANKNLSLNLYQYLGLANSQNFTIVKKGATIFSSQTTYSRSGGGLEIDYGGLFSSPTRIELSDRGARFKGGIFSGDQDIIVEPNRITYDPHGVFAEWSKSYVTLVGSSARIPGFWQDTAINKNKDGSINLGDALIVRHEGNRILFRYSGWFGSEHIYTMVRTKNRIVYYDENLDGVIIDIGPSQVRTRTSSGETFYTITRN